MRPVVDLPQPDSPTRPSVRPRAIAKSTPSTARTAPISRANRMPLVIGKCLVRPDRLDQRRVRRWRRSSDARRRARRESGSRCGGCRPRGGPAAARSTAGRRRRRRAWRRGSAARSGSRAAARTGSAPRPGSPAAARARRRARGCCRAGPRCRDGAAARRSDGRAACSTTRPAYITSTRSTNSATTPRSWVIRITAMPKRSCRLRSSSRIWAWIGDVERGGRLVGEQQARVAGRARSRSSPAGACRPRAGADTRSGAGRARGCRPASSRSSARRTAACWPIRSW